jgi:hypothetical protein
MPPSYGGKIIFENISSFNLYFVFETINEHELYKEVIFLIEKNEKVILNHTFYGWEMEETIFISNPVNYYTNILLYDLDNGNILNRLDINNDLFAIKEGSIELNNAIFQIIIDDNLINGTLYEK